MDASTPQTSDLQRQQDRKRKRKALLAGGVVLGLGAAVTLAAWSDDVFADGTFNTGGTFELVGSTTYDTVNDEYDYRDYDGPDGPAAESAQLSFNLSATDMIHSQTVYAPLTIATSADTPFDGTFVLDNVQATGPYAGLMTYRIYLEDTHGANCNANDAGNLSNEWTDPTGQTLRTVVNGLTSIPGLGTVLNGVISTLTTLLSTLGINPAAASLPVNDPIGALTAVSSPQDVGDASSAPKHLCIAATMGVVPPTVAGLSPRLVENINDLAVRNIDNSAGDTTVTWTFTGEPTTP